MPNKQISGFSVTSVLNDLIEQAVKIESQGPIPLTRNDFIRRACFNEATRVINEERGKP